VAAVVAAAAMGRKMEKVTLRRIQAVGKGPLHTDPIIRMGVVVLLVMAIIRQMELASTTRGRIRVSKRMEMAMGIVVMGPRDATITITSTIMDTGITGGTSESNFMFL
jgi:hypothetical protein